MRALAGGTFTANAATETYGIPKRTPLILLWSFITLTWSIFTPPRKTFAARMILFQPLWAVRIFFNNPGWTTDLLLFQCLHAIYGYFISGSWQLFSRADFSWLDLHDRNIQIYLQVFTLLGGCALFAGSIVFRGHCLRKAAEDEEESNEPIHQQSIEDQVLPPLLLPSRTTHSRLFPKTHSFSYSYLFVGIPVGVTGRINNVLSVDSPKPAWFAVEANDFLQRDANNTSLAEKLKRYLHTQGVTDRDYAYAYLVTAPRFGGYSFNPVSFWYLYDADVELKYMILEVNNTFDERRMYLLKRDPTANQLTIEKSPNGDEKQVTFSQAFEKDFHVSPFNSRKGSYSLRATDPLAASEQTGAVQIDNTIVLRSSKDHAKIVARVRSEGAPKDPATISALQLTRFILSWWWVGFATFPRIVYQAGLLFFKRRLHVWYRPEVTPTSISRPYTADEKRLEAFFLAYLNTAIAESPAKSPLRVVYEAAHQPNAETVLYSPSFTYEEDHNSTIEIKVLSPAFYSRVVHYATLQEAFDRECLATDEKNRTIQIQPATLLPRLLDAMQRLSPPSTSSQSKKTKPSWQWSLLTSLRCPPPPTSYPLPSPPSHSQSKDKSAYTITDIRHPSTNPTPFDTFILTYCPEESHVYRHILTKQFLAQRFLFGIPVLLDAVDLLVIRGGVLVLSMLYSDFFGEEVDILRTNRLWEDDSRSHAGIMVVGWGLANAVHLWGLVKG